MAFPGWRARCRRAAFYIAPLLATVVAGGAGALDPYVPPAPFECHLWIERVETLATAVRQHTCVALPEGEYTLSGQVNLPSDRRVIGAGRDKTILRAADNFSGTAAFATNGSQRVVVANLTVDMRRRAVGGMGATGMTIDNVRVMGAKCWGIGVAAQAMIVRNSLIEGNGSGCPVAPPGAGVYITGTRVSGAVFENNVIRKNTGPGIDINRARGGRITGNILAGNSGWAAISMFGASYWTVADNVIDQPATARERPYHKFCDSGRYDRAPRGTGTAGIMICHDSNVGYAMSNRIVRNAIRSAYGLLSIGADDIRRDPEHTRLWWVPRRNHIEDNDAHLSAYGCADDFRPGQWRGDDNVWKDNNCFPGVAKDRRPGYF